MTQIRRQIARRLIRLAERVNPDLVIDVEYEGVEMGPVISYDQLMHNLLTIDGVQVDYQREESSTDDAASLEG